MQNHAIELSNLGIDVSVHGVTDEYSDDDRSEWGDVPTYLSNSLGPKRIAFAPNLAKSIAAADPQIIHQHGLWQYPTVVVNSWRRRTGRPVVVSVQGMLEPWALKNARKKKKMLGFLYQHDGLNHASAIHASSSELTNIRCFVPNTPVAVLPNGAKPTDGTPLPRPAFLQEDGRRTLLFLGRLHPKKGISETLQAWKQLRDAYPHVVRSWRLAIVGWDDGGYADSLVDEAKSLGLSDDVIFPGAVFGAEKESVLHHSDAFILASHSEGFPMAVLEAFSYGLPVFMTQSCNIPEGFRAGAAIEITTNPDELAKILARELCQKPDKLAEIGECGKQLVLKHFSWRSIAVDLAGLYAYLLGNSPERPKFLV